MSNSEINFDLHKVAGYILNGLKYLSLACFAYCLFGLGTSINRNYPLWIDPLHAEGTIVNHQETSWQTYMDGASSIVTSTQLPVVEFLDSANVSIRFTDNLGHNFKEYKKVSVIYSKNDSKNAKIDKGFLNWLDTYIWLFGTIAGLLGMARFSTANIENM